MEKNIFDYMRELHFNHEAESIFDAIGSSKEKLFNVAKRAINKTNTNSSTEVIENIWKEDDLTLEEKLVCIFKVGTYFGARNAHAEILQFVAEKLGSNIKAIKVPINKKNEFESFLKEMDDENCDFFTEDD